MTDPRNPSPGLLCKLASIAVHAEEYLSPAGHQFDADALRALLVDGELKAWLATMTAAGLAPVKRNSG